jgi:hypothetical protein
MSMEFKGNAINHQLCLTQKGSKEEGRKGKKEGVTKLRGVELHQRNNQDQPDLF